MTNGVFCLNHFLRAGPALRAALAAVRQCPIASRSAIQRHVTVVSARKRAALRPLFTSPFKRLPNSDSFQSASRNIPATVRCAICSSDSHSSSP